MFFVAEQAVLSAMQAVGTTVTNLIESDCLRGYYERGLESCFDSLVNAPGVVELANDVVTEVMIWAEAIQAFAKMRSLKGLIEMCTSPGLTFLDDQITDFLVHTVHDLHTAVAEIQEPDVAEAAKVGAKMNCAFS